MFDRLKNKKLYAYKLRINCKVSQNGWRDFFLIDFLRNKGYLRRHKSLDFFIESTTCPTPYDIYWKVKNTGPEAERRNQVRGQILNKGFVIPIPNF